MLTKIELHNFQSHKNTVIDFDEHINSICGESDNGKTAIIRAIKWVIENRPLGTDKLNSNWNTNFKEPMSVKIYTDKGYVERIRDKNRNGYNVMINGNLTELNAVGSEVPQEVTDFFNLKDVNFQYQLDAPYLLSMTPGEASKYLNDIVHLDSIDKIMSVSDSNKRELNSKEKIITADIKNLEKEINDTAWVDDANNVVKEIDSITESIEENNNLISQLNDSINTYSNSKIIDISEMKNVADKIDNITLEDTSSLESDIDFVKNNKVHDLTRHNFLVSKIEEITLTDTSLLESEIGNYKKYFSLKNNNDELLEKLNKELPDICPYCGSIIKGDKHDC